MIDLNVFRTEKDSFFARHMQSPLTYEQRRSFRGLLYFPEDQSLRFEVRVERFAEQTEIQIPTSTGGIQKYQRYGRFKFEVNGEIAELTIYEASHGFFLPFVDSLAGKETYPAGRYLEIEPLGGDCFLVDFNLAYNPYCAYNTQWSCLLRHMRTISMCRFEQAKKSLNTKLKKEHVMSKPIAVTDTEFEKTVLQSEVPVIVDFWAPWCTPCKIIAPTLENIAQEYDGKLIIAKVNTDENSKWAMRYGVQGIPTLLFISGGMAIDFQVGVAPANVLKSKADRLLRTVPT